MDEAGGISSLVRSENGDAGCLLSNGKCYCAIAIRPTSRGNNLNGILAN